MLMTVNVKIDMHIHSNASDGKYTPEQIFAEAERQGLHLISITDHDSIASQPRAVELAKSSTVKYFVGIELNVTFSHPDYRNGKDISTCVEMDHLDILKRGVRHILKYRKSDNTVIVSARDQQAGVACTWSYEMESLRENEISIWGKNYEMFQNLGSILIKDEKYGIVGRALLVN